MKTTRKILCLVLALTMLLAMSVTAFAAGGSYSIKIGDSTKPVSDKHTFTAYQIFAGTLSTDPITSAKTLSNITWGDGVAEEKKATLLGVKANPAELAASLTADNLKEFAKTAKGCVDVSKAKTGSLSGSTYTISNLEAGYYLVIDQFKNDTVLVGDAASEVIVQIVGDVVMDPKITVPTVDKKVSTDSSNWKDTVDAALNQELTFKLIATLPNNLADYSEYKLVFNDTLSSGLTFVSQNNEVEVYVDSVKKTSYFTSEISGQDLTVTIPDVINLGGASGKTVTVVYKAKLNENAVLGEAGNPNTVSLQYSNDPSDTQLGKTPDTDVKVYTYGLTVNKVDGTGAPLKGAGFTLYPWNESEDAYAQDGIVGTLGGSAGETDTVFTWKQLAPGKYQLKETTTPDGFNTAKPIEIKIIGTPDGKGKYQQDSGFETGMQEDGTIVLKVINKAGSSLPETGGMGTTVFYVLGGLMVVAAAVLLITQKRMKRQG